MLTGMDCLREIQDRLNITETTFKKACEILKAVNDAELVKGYRLNVKSATIMFIACRLTNTSTSIMDLLKATGTEQQEINRCYKRMKPVLPGAYLSQNSAKHAEEACIKMKLDKDVIEVCKATADNISKLEVLTGKKPATIAGVAIYMIVKRSPIL